MQNCGRCTALGWAVGNDLLFSDHFEHLHSLLIDMWGLKSSRAEQFWASSLILSCVEPLSMVALDPGVSQGLARASLSQLKCTLKGHLSRAAGAHFQSLFSSPVSRSLLQTCLLEIIRCLL